MPACRRKEKYIEQVSTFKHQITALTRTTLFIVCALHVVVAFSQRIDEKNFIRYTTASGLSHNNVTSVKQDAAGFIWAAGSGGLNRFNGSRFIQYHSSDDVNAPASEEMTGTMWIDNYQLGVFSAGLYIFNTKTYQTRNLFIPYHDRNFQFKYNMIVRLQSDDAGNMYVLTRSGFYHFDKNEKLIYRYDYYAEQDVPNTHFFFGKNLYWYDDDRLLIMSIAGAFIYDINKKEFRKPSPQREPDLTEFPDSHREHYSFFQVRKKEFIIIKHETDTLILLNTSLHKKTISKLPFPATYDRIHYRSQIFVGQGGTYFITGQNAGFYKLLMLRDGKFQMDPELNFPSVLCTSLLTDRTGLLWIGTNRGLYKQNAGAGTADVMRLTTAVQDSFPLIKFDDVVVTDKYVYAAARGGGGLFKLNKENLKIEKQIPIIDNHGNKSTINALIKLSNDELLIASGGPLFTFRTQTEKLALFIPPGWNLNGEWAETLHKAPDGKIWISADDLYVYDPKQKTIETITQVPLAARPYKTTSDGEGRIWLASHGMASYDPRTKQFTVGPDNFPFIKMPDKQINAVTTDSRNRVWLNSANNGLICYDPATKKFRHFTKKDGLIDDNISSMICIDDQLWIACFSGLCSFDLNTNKITSYSRDDGLPRMPVTLGAQFFYDSAEATMYLGFATAVVRFQPKDLLRRKAVPKTFVESIEVNGRTITFPDALIEFAPNERDIRITIGTLNFTDRSTQHFAYRVTNDGEGAWMPIDAQPSFLLTGLSSGLHNIEMKVFSPDNRWSEQILKLSLVIRPPFWKRAWFIILMFAIFAAMLYKWMRWRTETVRKKEEEKTKIEKLKADDYKNRLELEHISHYFSSSLAGKRTKDEVLWDVAQNLIGKMNYEDCIIYLWNDDKTKLIQKAAYGPKGKPEHIVTQQFEVLPGQGIVGHVAKTKQALIVGDTRADERYRIDDQFRLSEVCVPIIHNNELLGVIDSEHSQANYFSERDVNILSTVAALIANKLKQIESEQTLYSKRKELDNINEQLAEARLSALQAQMNPHFVFNALNSIKRMILESENEKASRYLSKFAQMIRMTLEHSKNIFISLEENTAYLRAYIEMEQLRFDGSFSYRIAIDENIDAGEISVPSMMLQPIVENAVWHGLMQKKGDKILKLNFFEEDGKLYCEVEDNGIGIRASEKLKAGQRDLHNSLGLENLRNRLRIMNEKYDLGGNLIVTDLCEEDQGKCGTKITLVLNLINIAS